MTHLVSLHPFQPVVLDGVCFSPSNRYTVNVLEQPGRVLFSADVLVRNCVFQGVTPRGALLRVRHVSGRLPPSPFATVAARAKAKARGIRRQRPRVR